MIKIKKSKHWNTKVPQASVLRSQASKFSSSQAHKPFYSSQNPFNASLTLKQLLLVYIIEVYRYG